MDGMRVLNPDIRVMAGREGILTPFGMLACAFAQRLADRAGLEEGGYSYVPLEFLEEAEAAPQPAPRPAVLQLQLHLKLLLEALKKEGTAVQRQTVERVAERIVRMQSADRSPALRRPEKAQSGIPPLEYRSILAYLQKELDSSAWRTGMTGGGGYPEKPAVPAGRPSQHRAARPVSPGMPGAREGLGAGGLWPWRRAGFDGPQGRESGGLIEMRSGRARGPHVPAAAQTMQREETLPGGPWRRGETPFGETHASGGIGAHERASIGMAASRTARKGLEPAAGCRRMERPWIPAPLALRPEWPVGRAAREEPALGEAGERPAARRWNAGDRRGDERLEVSGAEQETLFFRREPEYALNLLESRSTERSMEARFQSGQAMVRPIWQKVRSKPEAEARLQGGQKSANRQKTFAEGKESESVFQQEQPPDEGRTLLRAESGTGPEQLAGRTASAGAESGAGGVGISERRPVEYAGGSPLRSERASAAPISAAVLSMAGIFGPKIPSGTIASKGDALAQKGSKEHGEAGTWMDWPANLRRLFLWHRPSLPVEQTREEWHIPQKWPLQAQEPAAAGDGFPLALAPWTRPGLADKGPEAAEKGTKILQKRQKIFHNAHNLGNNLMRPAAEQYGADERSGQARAVWTSGVPEWEPMVLVQQSASQGVTVSRDTAASLGLTSSRDQPAAPVPMRTRAEERFRGADTVFSNPLGHSSAAPGRAEALDHRRPAYPAAEGAERIDSLLQNRLSQPGHSALAEAPSAASGDRPGWLLTAEEAGERLPLGGAQAGGRVPAWSGEKAWSGVEWRFGPRSVFALPGGEGSPEEQGALGKEPLGAFGYVPLPLMIPRMPHPDGWEKVASLPAQRRTVRPHEMAQIEPGRMLSAADGRLSSQKSKTVQRQTVVEPGSLPSRKRSWLKALPHREGPGPDVLPGRKGLGPDASPGRKSLGLGAPPVWKGLELGALLGWRRPEPDVPLGWQRPGWRTLPEGQRLSLKASLERQGMWPEALPRRQSPWPEVLLEQQKQWPGAPFGRQGPGPEHWHERQKPWPEALLGRRELWPEYWRGRQGPERAILPGGPEPGPLPAEAEGNWTASFRTRGEDLKPLTYTMAPELQWRAAAQQEGGAPPIPFLEDRRSAAGSTTAQGAQPAAPAVSWLRGRGTLVEPEEAAGLYSHGTPDRPGSAQAPEGPAPERLIHPKPAGSPPAQEEKPNAPWSPMDSEYVRTLPSWAQRFLRSTGTAAEAGGPHPAGGPSMAVLPQPAEAREKPVEMVEWTAPYHPASAPLTLRERNREETAASAPPLSMSQQELRRTADQLYQLIEERIRRERRRLGL